MLQLTSYNRMLRYICSTAGASLTDTKAQKQMIVNWILAASKQIEKYLGRSLEICAYTEYFDTISEKRTMFQVKAYPIITLTDVYIDGRGYFIGAESEITDCFIGSENDCVHLPVQPSILGYKTIRIRYTGGLAYSGVRSTFTISTVVGTWVVDKFVYGGTSEAVGIIKSVSATTMLVEVLYGIFQTGETLYQCDSEEVASGAITAVLSVIVQQSLYEQYPDIVRAAEIQVRHYWKHKDDFELAGTSKDGTNRRNVAADNKSFLTKEATDFLIPYRNRAL